MKQMFMSNRLPFFVAAIVGIGFIFINIEGIWTTSVDIAHHYALIARLAEYWQLPEAFDNSLGEMNFYPPYSHRLAVILGTLLHSSFMGMQVVSLMALIVIWGSIAFMLFSLPASMYKKITITLLVLIVLNFLFTQVELFGKEIIGNYFYAQLVAQAFVFLIISVSSFLDKRAYSFILRYLLLASGILFGINFHLLPALELLALFWLLVLVDIFLYRTDAGIAKLFFGVAIALATTVGVFMSSALANMYVISNHEGMLNIKFLNTPSDIVIVSLIVASLSFYLFYYFFASEKKPKNDVTAIKYIALLGIAIAGGAILQTLALKLFGMGSEYGIKKYGFGLFTVLLIELSFFSVVFMRNNEVLDNPSSFVKRLIYQVSPAVIILFGILNVVLGEPVRDSRDFKTLVAIEKYIQKNRSLLIDNEHSKYSYALGVNGLLGLEQYLVSIGMLKSPRYAVSLDILMGEDLSDHKMVGYIITSKNSFLDDESCKITGDTDFSILNGACVFNKVTENCTGSIYFNNIYSTNIELHGFSTPEQAGRWNDGQTASIHCYMPEKISDRPTSVRLLTHGFVFDTHTQRMLVKVNDGRAEEFLYEKDHNMQEIQLQVPKEVTGRLNINFEFPDAISPVDLKLSADTRQLAVCFSELHFE